eukprot:641330-Alexandrium_andersonii.AAC.1
MLREERRPACEPLSAAAAAAHEVTVDWGGGALAGGSGSSLGAAEGGDGSAGGEGSAGALGTTGASHWLRWLSAW